MDQVLAQGARIVLACAGSGATNSGVVRRLGVSRPGVNTWQQRFVAHRLTGMMVDTPCPGVIFPRVGGSPSGPHRRSRLHVGPRKGHIVLTIPLQARSDVAWSSGGSRHLLPHMQPEQADCIHTDGDRFGGRNDNGDQSSMNVRTLTAGLTAAVLLIGLSGCAAYDRAAGTDISGVYPQQRNGTPANPPGTAATRAFDRAVGTDVSGAYPEQRNGTPVNPPGTALSRTYDRATGTDVSGAYPQNQRPSTRAY